MSTAEHPDALARRLEQLAAALPEGPSDEAAAQAASVVPHVEALHAELCALRAELTSVRAESGAAAQRSGAALEDVRGAVEGRLAVLEDALDGLSERLEAGLDRMRTQVTTELAGVRRDLASQLAAQTTALTAALTTALGARLEPITAASEALRRDLDAVRAGFDARAEELAATLARGLLDLAEEVDVAATTTRDAAQRVTVLTELTESQRVEVERLLREVSADVADAGQGLREELLARTTSLLGELGPRLDDVGVRLSAVDGTVAGGTVAAEQVAAGLDALTATTERLDAAVGDFRTEWPTRTYEVVQGARAVAEGVVLDVRAEVGARLDDVRATLERVVGSVDLARTGLHDGTDRLAQAGAVLVAYLEHRDRLLEAERDRVLSDVLDAFAAGLSARERSALAGRVSDAVARRRDARDAERYREAVGEPVSPTADLPQDVRALGERGPEPAPEPLDVADPSPEQAPAPAPAPAAPVRVAARPPTARRTTTGSGGSLVVPGPGRSAQPPARRASRTAATPGRGRLGAMPEAPSVDVALDAAAPRDDDRR